MFLTELRTPRNRELNEILSSIQACIDTVEDVNERNIGAQIASKLAMELLRRSDVTILRDNHEKRVVGLYHINKMPASSYSLRDSDGQKAARTDASLIETQHGGERVLGTETNDPLGRSSPASQPAHSSWDVTQESTKLRPSGFDVQYSSDEYNLEDLLFTFPTLVEWDLQPFVDSRDMQPPDRNILDVN